MSKRGIRAICDPIAKTSLSKKIGFFCLRIGNYIRRINREEEWSKLQENLSPINWGYRESVDEVNKEISSDKIKVRILHQQATMWNAISSVYEQFATDNKYDVLIILTGSSYNLCAQKEQMQKIGAKYIKACDYSFPVDKPDILLIYNAWVWNSFPTNLWAARDNTRMIVEIPLETRVNISTLEQAYKNLYMNEIKPDACIVDQYLYNLFNAFDKKYQYTLLGHPKTDVIIQRKNSKFDLPLGWDKLKGKKTLVFVTDHGITMDGVYQDCAFDIYAKDIFSYFLEHDEYNLIFRPHDSCINDLLHSFWSFADYEYLKKMIEKSPNIVWDTTDDFTMAYSKADAVISDLNCDLTASAILLNKPVAVLHRNDIETKAYSPEITDHYTNIHSRDDLMNFLLNEFVMGKDSLKEERNKNIKNVVCSYDGKNGKRIKKYIEDIYFKRMRSNK